jgi:hypothetical protein
MMRLRDGETPAGVVTLELYDVRPSTGELVAQGKSQVFDLGSAEAVLKAMPRMGDVGDARWLVAINGAQMKAYINVHGGMHAMVNGVRRRVFLVHDDYTTDDYHPAWVY